MLSFNSEINIIPLLSPEGVASCHIEDSIMNSS